MKDYKNGGLGFESEAPVTPGTIVLVGSETRATGEKRQAEKHKALTCSRVRINGCKPRRSSESRYGYQVERVGNPRESESETTDFSMKLADKSGSSSKPRERRRHVRVPYYRFVYFLCDEKYYEGVTKDISSGGLFIRTRGKLSVGTVLTLSIPKNPFEKQRTIQAEVVRVEAGGIGVRVLQVLKGQPAAPNK